MAIWLEWTITPTGCEGLDRNPSIRPVDGDAAA